MKVLARVVAATISLAATAFAVYAARIETTEVGGWQVGAYSNDGTGQFNHCTAAVPNQDGVSLILSVGRDLKWSMGFTNTQWRLNLGSEHDLDVVVDARSQLVARGRAIHGTLIAVDLVDSRALLESLGRAHQLHVRAAGKTLVFNIANASEALVAALDCVKRHLASPSFGSNSFVERPGVAQSARRYGGDRKMEAAIFVANVLTAAGVRGFRIMPREEMSAALQKHDAVWLAEGGLMGLLNIETSHSFSNAEQVAASLMSADSETCNGAFAAGRYPTPSQTASARLMTACRGTEKPTQVNYTIAPRPRGGFYVFAIVSPLEGASAARDGGARFHDAALRSLSDR